VFGWNCSSLKTVARVAIVAVMTGLGVGKDVLATGPVPAELRSAASVLPNPPALGEFAPSAPAGGLVVGSSEWVCDAVQGYAPVVAADTTLDPVLAVGAGAIHLPTAVGFGNATGGQMLYDGNGNVYITQGVLANNTPSSVQGILRVTVDPATGLPTGSAVVIASNSGLGGNQPTAIALGPDGNLYFGNLKNGDIKRILNPAVGNTQVVQSVGKTPNGRPVRSLAFFGNDLYIGSSDTLSRIGGATQATCQGGCNAAALADGFAGQPHVGLAADSTGIYFAVAGSVNQVWHVTPMVGGDAFAEVSAGGVDGNGNNAGGFAFVSAKCNLFQLDPSGNLWIGDDTSNGTVPGNGRIWTINSAQLASVGGGSIPADAAVVAAVRDNWFVELGNELLFAIFTPSSPGAAGGTYTATIESAVTGAIIRTSSGTYTISGAEHPLSIGNPQGHLNLTDSTTGQLIDGDIFLLRVDQFVMSGTDTFNPSIPTFFDIVWTKQTL
jgi:hypothetical protein